MLAIRSRAAFSCDRSVCDQGVQSVRQGPEWQPGPCSSLQILERNPCLTMLGIKSFEDLLNCHALHGVGSWSPWPHVSSLPGANAEA
ncbi:hypothetical protein Mnod_0098 [Methylobacterium nodulans ORS 2060]|uniref:Uncharacterized protein n=1 Tax=Methylobacterium nodulans (strain LMG 21967 / CNCM I-2342 / ORS 2060) TaxID=460265 RepID=B8IUA0_METNO|nr:hypothetical protein Mnod_0098 [Methylobacterium nodulans ORS 2060]